MKIRLLSAQCPEPELVSTGTSTGNRGTQNGSDRTTLQIYKSTCAVVDPIPTMSQWMLLMLGLLMSTMAVVYVKQKQGEMV